MTINFEEAVTVSGEQLQEISKLAQQQLDLEKLLEQTEQHLKTLKSQHKKIAVDLLPTAMQAAGMEKFTLTNGAQIDVKEALYMSIPKKNRADVALWLVEHGQETLIKNDVVIKFNKGEEDQVRGLTELLGDAGMGDRYSVEQDMNTASVKAAIRELLEQGEDVPLKLFGAYQETAAKITVPKG